MSSTGEEDLRSWSIGRGGGPRSRSRKDRGNARPIGLEVQDAGFSPRRAGVVALMPYCGRVAERRGGGLQTRPRRFDCCHDLWRQSMRW
jgi:hypothetical protein